MLDPDLGSSNVSREDVGELPSASLDCPADPKVQSGFGIWQLTAAFNLPASTQSVLSSDDLPRRTRAKIAHQSRMSPENNTRHDDPLFRRLTEAEGRLRTAFAADGEVTFKPIHNDPLSVERISPTFSRQNVSLLTDAPFNWLSALTRTAFTFRNLGDAAFFNDFLMQPSSPLRDEYTSSLDTALFNVAAMLADRRSHMLAQGLAERTYNLFLPAAMMYEKENQARYYILIPVLSCIRLSNSSCFRRTLSLSLVIIPVSKEGSTPRCLDVNEPKSLQSGWTLIPEPDVATYVILPGDLRTVMATYSSAWNKKGERASCLRELVQDLLFAIVERSLIVDNTKDVESLRDRMRDLVVRAVQASVCGGYCSVMPNITVSELRQWQGDPFGKESIGRKLNHEFSRLLGQLTMHEWAIAEPQSFRLEHGRGAEPAIPTFYFSFGPRRLAFTPSAADLESQYTSILWTAGWHILLMTGISALLEMLGAFHHEMERRSTATGAQEFLKEFLVDIEEYFDFDLLPVYRLDFDALKKVECIDDDFERLRERVTALGQERIIEEGRRTNLLLLWIGAASLFVSAAVLVLTFKPPEAPKPVIIERSISVPCPIKSPGISPMNDGKR